jgi:hypothetical protein
MPLYFILVNTDGTPTVDEHSIEPGSGKIYMRKDSYSSKSIVYAMECDISDEFSSVWRSVKSIGKEEPEDKVQLEPLPFKTLHDGEYLNIQVASIEGVKDVVRLGHIRGMKKLR